MSSGRGSPSVPPRPAFVDDEEEAIKRAIALSLVTIKEDEQRRFEQYGSTWSPSVPNVATSDQQRATSLISRARPKTSASPNMLPVVPPRPAESYASQTLPPRPKKMTQAQLDQPVFAPVESLFISTSDRAPLSELDRCAPRVLPPPTTVPRSRSKQVSAVSSCSALDLLESSVQGQSSSPGRTTPVLRGSPVTAQQNGSSLLPNLSTLEKPLISFSPNSDPLDFDLDSLDPLKGGGLVVPAKSRPGTSQNPFIGQIHNMSSALCPMNNFGLLASQQRSSSANALDNSLQQTSSNQLVTSPIPAPRNLGTRSTVPKTQNTEPPYLLPSPNRPLNCQSVIPNNEPLSKSLSTPASGNEKIAIQNASLSLVSGIHMTRNIAYGEVDHSIFLKKSPTQQRLDPSPVGWPPKKADPKPITWPESKTDTANWLQTGNWPTLEPALSTNMDPKERVSTLSNNSNYTIPDGAMVFHRAEPGDLMDFSASKDQLEYLSLESFDPLYSLERSIDMEQSTDSIGLFPNPLDRLQRRNTPNPFPSINPVTTQNLLRKSSIDIINQSSSVPSSASPSRPVSSISGYEELQDPFDIPELLKSLEVKRQKHAKEQAERVLSLKKQQEESDKAKAVPSSAPTPGDKKSPGKKSSPRAVMSPARRCLRSSSYMQPGEEVSYEILQDFPETSDEEIQAFCSMVAGIKMKHRNTDFDTNPGVVISPKCKHPYYKDLTVKLLVKASFIEEPGFPFTCDVNSTVSHVIGAVLIGKTDSLETTSTDNYVLKVYGYSEYFLNDTCLADYHYVQECLKLDVDISLVLEEAKKMDIAFKRTPEDDRNALFVPKTRELADVGMRITKDKLNISMETFYKEVEKLRDAAIQNGLDHLQSKSVIQCVKAICALLHKMESIDVLQAIERLQSVNKDQKLHVVGYPDVDGYVMTEGEGIPVRNMDTIRKILDLDDLHVALEELTMSVKSLIELYCRTFHTDFRFRSTTQVIRDKMESNHSMENLIVHIASAYRIPLKVKEMYKEYKIICGLYYGGHKLVQEVVTVMQPSWGPIFGETLIWDEWVTFDSAMLCSLPRETRLCLTLVGVKYIQTSSSDVAQKVNTPLGWVGLQLYNYEFMLTQGSQLLGLWMGDLANPTGTSIANTEMPGCILLQVNLPQFEMDYVFPAIQEALPSVKQDFESMHPDDQETITSILEKDSITPLTEDEGEFLWEKRHYLYDLPEALPRVVQQIGSWYWGSLTETYSMTNEWTALTPIQSLELLLPHYPDTFIREKAANWLGSISSDDLCDYLPQLVQALKFESYHTSALAALILDKAICSVRVAHRLYWLLKEAADDVCYRKRYQLMFGALMSIVGEKMRKELSNQEDIVKMFSAIADKVKAAKDKEGVLSRELFNMWEFLKFSSVRLPLDPAMEITGIDVKSCSYFTSFTFPLKLVLRNKEPKADCHYAMFKAGDDLRQDMLTMQMIDLMDKLWLKEGLDLKMVTFTCVHTGKTKGLVRIITESETLRKIQVKHGVTGSFKDRPIAEWLQLQNPTELEYQKAVANFTASCAGYCVATYILGIGDRHNDNIMVKQSGHLFHIDFAKFLGDTQKFGNMKRDRVPFVLTPDMAYVINGGDKPSDKFQHFIDLCCQGFNILRKSGNLFINLLSMMRLSGIPGVTDSAGKYVQKALMPDCSDAEATAVFTRMLHGSLKSSFTQFNFFLHNLAQMKFHGHSDGSLLSFIPKTYTINQDGKIKHVEIHGVQKRYSPEKFYLYIIRVERMNQTVPNLVFRRYSEFQELHYKLVTTFPLVRLPRLQNRVLLGRTHVRNVADERRAELESFLQELLRLAPEIAECDLIYTFFHPMLKDEQDAGKTNLQKLRELSPPRPSRVIQGQVKVAVSYKNNLLTVMVMHVKDLSAVSGSEAPNPYVKLYLQPDPSKQTKRKTKIQRHTFHPTYNEMLYYHMPLDVVKSRTLQVTVWDYDKMKENEFLGACFINLSQIDLTKDDPAWYPLQAMHAMSTGHR